MNIMAASDRDLLQRVVDNTRPLGNAEGSETYRCAEELLHRMDKRALAESATAQKSVVA